MSAATPEPATDRPPYPFGEPDVNDLGSQVYLKWDGDEGGFIWHHPTCRPWSSVRFVPDPRSTGHRREGGGPGDMMHFSVGGSLLCPMGCGFHGHIRDGRWINA